MPKANEKVIMGVDTHKDFHHVAVISSLGESLADRRFDATPGGYDELIGWVNSHGCVLRPGLRAPARMGQDWLRPVPTGNNGAQGP